MCCQHCRELGGFSFLTYPLCLEKNSFVTSPYVELFHCCYHFSMLFSLSWCSISLFGILLLTYVVVSGCLLSEFVSKFISIVPCVRFYPCLFYVSVFPLQWLRPLDGNDLLKRAGVNLECINKSCHFLDTFVGRFVTILQRCSVQLSRLPMCVCILASVIAIALWE
jgi:hypothetical protein